MSNDPACVCCPGCKFIQGRKKFELAPTSSCSWHSEFLPVESLRDSEASLPPKSLKTSVFAQLCKCHIVLSGSVSTPQSRISRNKSDLFLSALKAGLGSCLPLSTVRHRQLDTYWKSGTLTQTPVLPGQELSVATALGNSVIILAHLGFPSTASS